MGVNSETTPQGVKKTQLAQTLLNGSNIAMVRVTFTRKNGKGHSLMLFKLIPGSNGPDS